MILDIAFARVFIFGIIYCHVLFSTLCCSHLNHNVHKGTEFVLISYHVVPNAIWCTYLSHNVCKGIELGNNFLPCAYQRSQKFPISHNVHTGLKQGLIMVPCHGFSYTPKNILNWVHIKHERQLCLN